MAKWSSIEIREASKYGQGTGHFQRMVLEILADLIEEKERVDALRRIADKTDTERTKQLVASLGVQTGQGKKKAVAEDEQNIPTTKA